MKPIADMTEGEFAALIQSHLRAKGIDVVLTAGSAVTIYGRGKYVSKDLDFVAEGFARRSKIAQAWKCKHLPDRFKLPDQERIVKHFGVRAPQMLHNIRHSQLPAFETSI